MAYVTGDVPEMVTAHGLLAGQFVDAPVGSPSAVRVTVPVKPLPATGATVTVKLVEPPTITVAGLDVGVSVTVKSGDGVTTKFTPLLAVPSAVTTTLPVAAPKGTVTAMLVAVQPVDAAAVPLKVTAPLDPKLLPVIVTRVPTGPELCERPLIAGAAADHVP